MWVFAVFYARYAVLVFHRSEFSAKLLAMLSYQQARDLVISRMGSIPGTLVTETIALHEAVSRVLAHDIVSDREYPPFDRAIRDGYAVRTADTRANAELRCIGELKAGDAP